MILLSFSDYSDQHCASDQDNVADIVESIHLGEAISPTVAKVGAMALLVRMNRIARTISGADSKALASQITLLGYMISLSIATMTGDSQSVRRI